MPIFHSDAINDPIRSFMFEEILAIQPKLLSYGYNWINISKLEVCDGAWFTAQYCNVMKFYEELCEWERAKHERNTMDLEDINVETLWRWEQSQDFLEFIGMPGTIRWSPDYEPMDLESSDSDESVNLINF